jgi:putative flippase GtrA
MLPDRYQGLRLALAARVGKHPLWARLTRTALSTRFTKYALGSVVAFTLSNVAFALVYVMGATTTACSVAGFIAGAIPNWILNRRWAWRVEGRIAFGREVVAYVIVSALTLFITAETTAWTQRHVQSIPAHHGIRVLLVTGSYLAVFAVLFVARFMVYEVWIFSGRSRIRAAFRSRIQVRNAARANRTP